MAREVLLSTPGEILAQDWLEPLGISQYTLAKAISVPAPRINEIVNGARDHGYTAVRLGVFFNVDPRSWMNLQAHYDTERAKARIGEAVLREIKEYAVT